jgi:hypothetical protein
MRSPVLLFIAILFLAMEMGCAPDQSEEVARLRKENEALKAQVSPLPSSLDKLFPPEVNQPVFLFSMIEMGMSLSSIAVDFLENDAEGTKANFERFKTQYEEVSKLVPEWEKKFLMGPVEELGAALNTGDQGKVMGAFEKVGKVCHTCHISNMPRVQHKYHWGDFSQIIVADPITKEEVDYRRFMQYLEMSFVGIGVDLQQQQKEKAQEHFQGFKARFLEMKEVCMSCHDTEREYYVDQDVMGMVDKLGEVVKSETPDPKTIEELVMGIGMESCFKCHLVHVPGTYAKNRWEMMEKVEVE